MNRLARAIGRATCSAMLAVGIAYVGMYSHAEITTSQAFVSVDLPYGHQLLAYASHGPNGSAVGIGQIAVYTYHGLNSGVGIDPGPFLPCVGFEVRGNPGPFIDREC